MLRGRKVEANFIILQQKLSQTLPTAKYGWLLAVGLKSFFSMMSCRRMSLSSGISCWYLVHPIVPKNYSATDSAVFASFSVDR